MIKETTSGQTQPEESHLLRILVLVSLCSFSALCEEAPSPEGSAPETSGGEGISREEQFHQEQDKFDHELRQFLTENAGNSSQRAEERLERLEGWYWSQAERIQQIERLRSESIDKLSDPESPGHAVDEQAVPDDSDAAVSRALLELTRDYRNGEISAEELHEAREKMIEVADFRSVENVQREGKKPEIPIFLRDPTFGELSVEYLRQARYLTTCSEVERKNELEDPDSGINQLRVMLNEIHLNSNKNE